MRKIIGLGICILLLVVAVLACGLPQEQEGTGGDAAPPQTIQHWVTKAISNDGLEKYSGNLEIFLNDDGSAFVHFRDYNVRDGGSEEYQTDDDGKLYNGYGLFYTWSEALDTIAFGQMDANDYYVIENNQIHFRRVKPVSDKFTIGKGKLRSDGTMEIPFAFSYIYEEGYRNPAQDYFILEQTDDLAGAEWLTTESEAQNELLEIESAIKKTDEFCRAFIAACPRKIAQVYAYNNYEKVRGSFWFGLSRAEILYGGGALFAVADVTLYPEYEKGGPAKISDDDAASKDIEVLRNENTRYSLLYESGKKPSDEVLEGFVRMDGNETAKRDETGALQDFFYSFGSGFSDEPIVEYELMALDMVDEEGGGALLYIKENDTLLSGYPVEVAAGKLDELSRIIDQYGIWNWYGDYEPDDMVTDGYGYFLAAQYAEDYLYSNGYMEYPDGYQKGHEAIAAFFENMREEQSVLMAQQEKPEMIEGVAGIITLTFAWGNYLEDASWQEYHIELEDEGLELSYGRMEEPIIDGVPLSKTQEQEIIDIYKKHGVFAWNGFEEKDDKSSDFVFLNDIYANSEGRTFNMIVYGVGREPEGFAAFREELATYLNHALGVE